MLFPKGIDANEYACKGESLAALLNRSEKPPAPAPQEPTLAVNGDEIVIQRNDRRYRIRGLPKNLSPEVMKVNVLVSRGSDSGRKPPFPFPLGASRGGESSPYAGNTSRLPRKRVFKTLR